jgi:hypothetical protein
MADAGAIGVQCVPAVVGAYPAIGTGSVQLPVRGYVYTTVWAAWDISVYPVVTTPSQLGAIATTRPVWELRGSITDAATVPINGKIEGYVYASVGTPAPYVWVRLYVPETGGLIYQQRADVNGYYKFVSLNPGEAYTVVAGSKLDPTQGAVMAMAQVQAVPV